MGGFPCACDHLVAQVKGTLLVRREHRFVALLFMRRVEHGPLIAAVILDLQDTQPVKASSLYRSMTSTAAPMDSAPRAASRTKAAVFQPERGLQLMATIVFI